MQSLFRQAVVSLLVSLLCLSVYHVVFLDKNKAENPQGDVMVPTRGAEKSTAQFVKQERPSRMALATTPPVSFTEAARKSMPAVVHIKSIRQQAYADRDPFYEFFGLRPQQRGSREMVSTGSGVLISEDGFLVTNNHVIAQGDRLEVTLADNRNYEATVVGTDPSTDLAVLKIEATQLPFLRLINSDDVEVGQWVLAVGNPFNLASTATAGIVSAIGRDLEIIKDRAAIESFIQTDAAVNPGNSGGALVNLNGDLVGVNTAIASPTGTYAGYAFAVPSNIVRKVVSDLRTYGSVQRGYTGINEIVNVDGKSAAKLGLNVTEGVFVQKLDPTGAAKKAGVRAQDIILEADGIKVRDDARFKEILARKRPGDDLRLTVLRNGKRVPFSLSLTNESGTTDILGNKPKEILTQLGVSFAPIPDRIRQELKYYDIEGGVLVEKLVAGKLRQQTEIQAGFVIFEIDGKSINDPDVLVKKLETARGLVKIRGYYPGRNRSYAYELKL